MLLFFLLLCLSPKSGDETPEQASSKPTLMETITVTAEKAPVTLAESTSKVSVIDEDQIKKQLVNDVHDLVRYEPGISIAHDNTRLGLNGFVIRGIGGNRVHARIDGVRTAEQFDFGPVAVNQYFVDVDTLKSVEIVRSAASSLYGSDALGGMVSFRTKDPADYLAGDDQAYYRLKTGYDGKNEGAHLGLTAAFAHNRFQGMIHTVARRSEAYGNQANIDSFDQFRTLPNDSDINANQYLLKGVWQVAEGNSLRATAEIFDGDTETDVYSSQGLLNQFGLETEISDSRAFDTQFRYRFSLDQQLIQDTPLFDLLSWQLYTQDNKTKQETTENRVTVLGPSLQRIERTGTLNFAQSTLGATLELQKGFSQGATEMRLIYGLDFSETRFSQLRDRRDFDLDTGNPNAYTGSLVFPARYFPKSAVTQTSGYAQLESRLWQGRLKIMPGLRYDRHKLSPDPNDEVFLTSTAANQPPVASEDEAFSPKLGINLRLTRAFVLTGQYASGFRAPPYSSVNNGFTNPAGGYRTLSNANLKPETSDNLEFGIKLLGKRGSLNLVYFHNDYEDFIDDAVFLGLSPDGLAEFQPRNVEAVSISGFEFAGDWQIGQSWKLKTAFADIEGEDQNSGLPLNRIEPRKWVVGLAYQSTNNRYGAELTATAVDGKDRSDVDGDGLFLPANYHLWDTTCYWNIDQAFTLNLGGFNLTDEAYHQWTNINGRSITDPTLDRYTSPGRTFSLNLSYQW